MVSLQSRYDQNLWKSVLSYTSSWNFIYGFRSEWIHKSWWYRCSRGHPVPNNGYKLTIVYSELSWFNRCVIDRLVKDCEWWSRGHPSPNARSTGFDFSVRMHYQIIFASLLICSNRCVISELIIDQYYWILESVCYPFRMVFDKGPSASSQPSLTQLHWKHVEQR